MNLSRRLCPWATLFRAPGEPLGPRGLAVKREARGIKPRTTSKIPYMAKKDYNMVFPTKYSESVQIGTFETFTKPSMTEPDNAMSIPEIIARFTRGYGIQVPVHPWQSGSAFEGDDPDRFLEEEFGPVKQAQAEAPKEPQKEAPAEPEQPSQKQEGD